MASLIITACFLRTSKNGFCTNRNSPWYHQGLTKPHYFQYRSCKPFALITADKIYPFFFITDVCLEYIVINNSKAKYYFRINSKTKRFTRFCCIALSHCMFSHLLFKKKLTGTPNWELYPNSFRNWLFYF